MMERNEDFNIGWDETDFRLYDPQIGRFLQIDELANMNYDYEPYAYANNNPISLNDPIGLFVENAIIPVEPSKVLPEVIIRTTVKKKKSNSVGQRVLVKALFRFGGQAGRLWTNSKQPVGLGAF